MKPDWDRLMDQFEGNPHALVADIDCTAEGKPLCTKHGVQGYPTIKWGDPTDLQDYQGGRTFDDLQSFAEENLGPSCGPDSLDLCDDEEREKIEKFISLDDKALRKRINKLEKKKANAEQDYENTMEKMEKKKKRAEKDKKKALNAVKKAGLPTLKKIQAARAKKKAEEEAAAEEEAEEAEGDDAAAEEETTEEEKSEL